MKIDKFLEINESDLINRRLAYNNVLKEEADKARKRFYAYKSHRNYVKYLQAKKDRRTKSF
jgi:hypothetical protein